MKILLVCSAGMSTSLLVSKMEKAADAKGIAAEILAIPEAKIADYLDKGYGVIMLGPQVRFLEKKITEMAKPKGIPVTLINMTDYGTMNGEKVLSTAIDIIENK